MLDALDRIEQINVRLAELNALEVEKGSLEQFCNVTSALIEHYGLSRPVPAASERRELKRVEESDMPIQALKYTTPDDDRLWKIIHMVMGIEGRPMTAGQVLAALQKQHVELNGTHQREHVRTAMIRREDIFERVSRGLFALKSWDEATKHSGLELREQDEDLEGSANSGEPILMIESKESTHLQ